MDGKGIKEMKKTIALLSFCVLLASTAYASSRDDLKARIDSAKTVLDEIMGAKDKTIPSNILRQATCVAVVPGMLKGAFVVGASYGQGIVTCRTGHGWSAPVFIRMAGGSFGFQAGGQATDLILVAVNARGMQDLLKDKFKIGGDASAAAGPVGRSGEPRGSLLESTWAEPTCARIRKTRRSSTGHPIRLTRSSRVTCLCRPMRYHLSALWPRTSLLRKQRTNRSSLQALSIPEFRRIARSRVMRSGPDTARRGSIH
jgi:hypothetical protein